jgi:anti-anti-sigma regulatory factor
MPSIVTQSPPPQANESPTQAARDTLELKLVRLPAQVDAHSAPKILAELDQLLAAEIGVVLDFSQTQSISQDAIKLLKIAADWAKIRSSSLSTMGENEQVRSALNGQLFTA